MSAPQPQHGQRQRQPGTANTGSQTVTATDPSTQVPDSSSTGTPSGPILRLRGAHAPGGPRVQWAESVVDNEGLGRKSSKVCCIYHAPRAVGESSSSESSSDSDSDSDSSSSGSDSGRARRRVSEHGHDHDHDHDHDHNQDHAGGCSHNHAAEGRTRRGRQGDENKPKRRRRRPSPNAYEKQPKPRPRPGDTGGSSGGQRSDLKGAA